MKLSSEATERINQAWVDSMQRLHAAATKAAEARDSGLRRVAQNVMEAQRRLRPGGQMTERDELIDQAERDVPDDVDYIHGAVAALVDAGWRPPPRVWPHGSTIPAGVRVMSEDGYVYPSPDDHDGEWDAYLGDLVEVLTESEWHEAVRRCR